MLFSRCQPLHTDARLSAYESWIIIERGVGEVEGYLQQCLHVQKETRLERDTKACMELHRSLHSSHL